MKKDQDYLKQYFNYLKKYRKPLVIGLICIPFISAAHIVQPLIIKYVIDEIILPKDLRFLEWAATALFGMVILEFGLRSWQSYLFQSIGQKTVTDIRSDLYQHINELNMSYLDKTPQGVLSARLTSDLESLNDSFATGIVTLIADVLTIIGIVAAMLFLNVELTAVSLAIILPLVIFINICRKKLRYFYSQIRSTIGKLNASIQEQLEGLSIIQQYNRQALNQDKFNVLNTHYRKSTLSSVSYDALLYSVIESMASIFVGLIIAYSMGLRNDTLISVGLLVAFIDYIQKLFQPLKEISNKFAILQHALASLEKIFGLLNIQEKSPYKAAQLQHFEGAIQIQDLSFYYPNHKEKQILNKISFDIQPHQSVAIVGPTGSGKSTLAKILLGLYEGYSGSIMLGNTELRALNLQSLRSQISSVSQDIRLFNQSIAFNVSLGNPSISESQILEALELAQASHLLARFEHGIHSKLQQFGQNLSAGEAQLIGFARALANPAPFIILDEASANLDSFAEQAIQKATQNLFKHKTVLVIAHRLSTIKESDCIISLKDGQIIEKGTHTELMAQQGFYAKLYSMQQSQQETL